MAGDGRIPNLRTPTGDTMSSPRSCAVTFSASTSVTAATVNAWITTHQNAITGPTTVCLTGVFTSPIHVWAKTSDSLLELASTPGHVATIDPGFVTSDSIDANEWESDTGAVSIIDSRSVEIYGITINHVEANGTAVTPAGILVESRDDVSQTNLAVTPHRSACFVRAGGCGSIYVIDDTVENVANVADSDSTSASLCGNANVDAYGIAVIGAGPRGPDSLQHVVIEDDTVENTRTGQSETIAVNGSVTDFLVADNVVRNADNIGMDAIGWETGTSQANHGLIVGNTVTDVDTYSNDAYGVWRRGSCVAQPENAAGIYIDGASDIWIDDNTVWNADQGINLDVETAHRSTSGILVTSNTVVDSAGTSLGDPSTGPEPASLAGESAVAGHDFVAFYVDAFGAGATISDVYAADNQFTNASQYYLTPLTGMPVVDLGGRYSHVTLWHNEVTGGGATDTDNPLLEIDSAPGASVVIDCTAYERPSTSSDTVNANYATPTSSYLSLVAWRAHNGHGFDAHSTLGAFNAACRTGSFVG
jgi:hypothetical protein